MTLRSKKLGTRSGKKRSKGRKTTEAIRHKQNKRRNIPTRAHKRAALNSLGFHSLKRWPRDFAKDPQLVWGGKFAPQAEEDMDLVVPKVGLQILEKISPLAIIENLRAYARGALQEQQQLFGRNFNGLPEEYSERLRFYQHEGNWQNRMILGDSLQVMNSLLEMEEMAGKVQMCYIDPPYGIKFKSNWQASTSSHEMENNAKSISPEPEVVQAFRDNWKLGIHSYLTYLNERLFLARKLLTESGSCFVQISEKNVHYVRCLLDEIFGEENFVSQITYKVTSGNKKKQGLRRVSDFILWYAKNKEQMKFHRLYIKKEINEDSTFKHYQMPDGKLYRMTKEEMRDPSKIPENACPCRTLPLHSTGSGDSKPRKFNGKEWFVPANSCWRHKLETFERLVKENRIVEGKSRLEFLYYFSDSPYSELTTTWADTGPEIVKKYVVQTSTRAIQRCMLMTTDPGDLVIDPTCGSGTTAYVAEQWGRRWITVDTSRISLAIARVRLMTASYDAYSHEEKRGPSGNNQLKFEYENFREITPTAIGDDVNVPIVDLYDQPLIKANGKGARVSGAFTVEALLEPSRMVPNASDAVASELDIDSYHAFSEKMLEQLRTSGARGQTIDQHTNFSSLVWREGGLLVTAEGETESDPPKRAAVAFVAEFASIDREFVDGAVNEIIDGENYDILYICGFQVESDVFDYATNKFKNPVVQIIKMNAELHMAEKLTKSEDRNLFSVFGAPDIIIRKREIERGGGICMQKRSMAR